MNSSRSSFGLLEMVVGLFLLSLSFLSLFPLLQAIQKEGHSQYSRFLCLKMAEQHMEQILRSAPSFLTSSDSTLQAGGVDYRLRCKVIPEKNHLYRIWIETGNAKRPQEERVSLASLYFPAP